MLSVGKKERKKEESSTAPVGATLHGKVKGINGWGERVDSLRVLPARKARMNKPTAASTAEKQPPTLLPCS